MKILVLGAGGMAGHVIAIRLAELGHTITGLARRKLPYCDTLIADVMENEKLKAITEYDAVINCIGILNREVDSKPSSGIWLNSCLPHLLSELALESNTKIIHMSTDCVFSGHNGGDYSESSFRSADTLYGRSKALGELFDNKNLTFRMSVVGPDINEHGIGLFNWFIKQSDKVNGYTNVVWSGVTTNLLANAIDAALKQDLSGVYHLVNNAVISKHDLLALFNELRREPVNIVPFGEVKDNKSMVNTRKDFDFAIPSYADMVSDLNEWINEHKALYKHYEGVLQI